MGMERNYIISWKNKWNPVPIVFIWQAQFLLPVYVLAVTQAGILYTTGTHHLLEIRAIEACSGKPL